MFTTILLSLLSGIVIIITSLPDIIDNSKRGLERIKLKGYILIGSVLFLIILPIAQYFNQQDIEKDKDAKQKVAQDKRDSTLQSRYDSSLLEMKYKFDSINFKTDSVISDNLGKYGYRFDSAAAELKKVIKDSGNNFRDDPVVTIASYGEKKAIQVDRYENDSFFLRINYVCLDAGSCCFKLKLSFVDEDVNGIYEYVGNEDPINYEFKFFKDSDLTSFSHIFTQRKPIMIYLWLRGTFKRLDKSSEYSCDQVYYYNVNAKTAGQVKGVTREKVIKMVTAHE